MQLAWITEKHGTMPCTYHGIADDGRVIIRLKDPYDPGQVEIKVPRSEVQGLEQERTKPAIVRFGRGGGILKM